MHNYNTLSPAVKKYWYKRYSLFSRYDEGIYLNEESWYSVTPEDVAEFIVKLVKQKIPNCSHVLDVCSGAGGNTIQFAREFDVVAVDVNPTTVECLIHNAGIYGVNEHVTPILGNWQQLWAIRDWLPLEVVRFDFAFSSPPWGGPAYNNKCFDLAAMEPFSLTFLCETLCAHADNFALFLPRSSNLAQISQVSRDLFGSDARVRVIYLMRDDHPVGLLACFGPAWI